MWTRKELKDNAKNALSRNYWPSVAVSLIIMALCSGGGVAYSASNSSTDPSTSAVSQDLMNANVDTYVAMFITMMITVFAVAMIAVIINSAIAIFVANPMLVGGERFFLTNGTEGQNAQVGLLGYGFKDGRYMNIVKTIFLKDLFQWLWSLLLIVPGIIKGYEYRMIPYLMAENPQMDYKTAFALSKKMMDGEKWNAFVLDLSFIGWSILCLCTCFALEVFYVGPYRRYTNAQLYLSLRNRLQEEGILEQNGLNGFAE